MRTITVRIGALRQVVPESLEFYIDVVARGSVCEGAALELALVPAELECTACGRCWSPDVPQFRCSECGAAGEVVAGNEFEVESIVIEEEPCIAYT